MPRLPRIVTAAALAACTYLALPAGAVAAAATPGTAGSAAITYSSQAAASCPQELIFAGLAGQRTYGRGQFCLFALSSNRDKYFAFHSDGSLVYYYTGRALWSSDTAGRGAVLALQGDGNMVIYDSAGRAIWATMTVGIGSTTRRLVMQYDGNVVLYKYPYQGIGQTAVWATGTNARG